MKFTITEVFEPWHSCGADIHNGCDQCSPMGEVIAISEEGVTASAFYLESTDVKVGDVVEDGVEFNFILDAD